MTDLSNFILSRLTTNDNSLFYEFDLYKRYVTKDPSKAPEGVTLITGSKGGIYYETDEVPSMPTKTGKLYSLPNAQIDQKRKERILGVLGHDPTYNHIEEKLNFFNSMLDTVDKIKEFVKDPKDETVEKALMKEVDVWKEVTQKYYNANEGFEYDPAYTTRSRGDPVDTAAEYAYGIIGAASNPNSSFYSAKYPTLKSQTEALDSMSGAISNLTDRYTKGAADNDKLIPQYEAVLQHLTDQVKSAVEGKDVMTRISPEDFVKVLKEGRFKSQFETGDSNGLFDPTVRSNKENDFFNYPADLNPDLRPIYGYMSGKNTEKGRNSLTQYGDISIIFKDSVKDRTTFNIGDSIDTTNGLTQAILQPVPVNDPNFRAAPIVRLMAETGPLKTTDANPDQYSYNEAQIHEGVTVDDIKSVILRKGVSDSKKVISLLDKHNIDYKVIK